MIITAKDAYELFTQVNKDSVASGDQYVPITKPYSRYYITQAENIWGLPYKDAKGLIKEMMEYAKQVKGGNTYDEGRLFNYRVHRAFEEEDHL